MSKVADLVASGESVPMTELVERAVEAGMKQGVARRSINTAVRNKRLKYVGRGRPGPNRTIQRTN